MNANTQTKINKNFLCALTMTAYLGLTGLIVGFNATPAEADTHIWQGQTGIWSDPTKWNPAIVPDSDDVAQFSFDQTYTVTVNTPTTSGRVDFATGFATLELLQPLTLTSTIGSPRPLRVNNGTGSPGDLIVTSPSAGTNLFVDSMGVGFGSGFFAEGDMTIQSSAEIAVTKQVDIAFEGRGDVTIKDSAKLSAADIFIGKQFGSSVGTLTIDGSSANVTTTNLLHVAQAGSGTLSLINGSMNTGSAQIGNSTVLGGSFTGTGNVTINDNWTNTNDLNLVKGTLVLDGGTITTGGLSGQADGTFHFLSGTLNVTGAGGLTLEDGANPFTRTIPFNNMTLGTGKTLNVSGQITASDGSSLAVTGGNFSTTQLTVTDTDSRVVHTGGSLNITNGNLTVQSNGVVDLSAPTGAVINGDLSAQSGGKINISGAVTADGIQNLAGGSINSSGGSISIVGGSANNTNSGQVNLISATFDSQKSFTNATGGQVNVINSTLNVANATGTRFFTDVAVWQDGLTGVETLTTTGPNILLANEVSGLPDFLDEPVGPTLTFDAATTGLSRSFQATALQSGAGFTFNDGEPFTIPGVGTFPPINPFNAGFTNALSVGDINDFEDDDWEVAIQSGPQLFAFGIFLNDNTPEPGETFDVFGPGDVLIATTTAIPAGGSVFIGVVSDQPITRVAFNEASGGDDIAIADFRFAQLPTTLGMTNQAGATLNAIGSTLNFPTDGLSNDIGLINDGTLKLIDTTVNGDVRSTTGSVIEVGGITTFTGFVSVAGNFTGNGTAVFQNTFSPGNSPAAITFGGNYQMGSNASLIVEVFGTSDGSVSPIQFDQLNVTDNVSLDGTLELVVDTATFTPDYGHTFTILTYGTRTGAFDEVTLNGSILTLQTDLALAPVYDFPGSSNPLFADTLFDAAPDTLTIFTTLPGDANLDLLIDGRDLSLLLAHFGNTGAAWINGDFTGDGTINGADLSLLLANYGGNVRDLVNSTGLSTNAVTIPEPATLTLLSLGCLLLVRFRTA